MKQLENCSIMVSAGSTYLDIDAYACIVAMTELLCLKGENAIAYSTAPRNYSVCRSLISDARIEKKLPKDIDPESARYIIVDVSDPDYIKAGVSLDRVVAVYDHHVGFEEFWKNRIGGEAHIEFIGVAATLIYREWKKAGLSHRMKGSTARLMIAAILDNTLNLTSSNTTDEDREAYADLCTLAGVDDSFRDAYFSEVQASVESDLRNALMCDMKRITDNPVLPEKMFQLCVWNADGMLKKIPDIRTWFEGGWLLNLIDIKHGCSYFVCDDRQIQVKIEHIFNVHFEKGVAKSEQPYLRKQILKHVLNSKI